ncbi:DedA family protein [Fluviispira sanaruensis]|uniref:DedA family protein n=1 Tax=Fluviispira sanaruensis TaxID=2493639 RepID=A0A4P2VT39_FLUSA|nr:DedA family protein [Fluviispira sanaruensis]BBH52022.1 DedA family protein [Fluviispira sanaruensis]
MLLDSLIEFFTTYGYIAVFGVLLLCGFGLPIPEDITLVAGGVISSVACAVDGTFMQALQSCHQVHLMFAVSMAGVLIGDSTMFFLGYIFGNKLLKVKFFARIVTQDRYNWTQSKFEKYGFWFIFAARFMPGLRSPIYVVTGITRKVSYIKFILTDGLAAIISVPLWVYLGFWGQRQLTGSSELEHYVKKGQMGIITIIGIAIVSLIIIWYIKKKIKEKTNI